MAVMAMGVSCRFCSRNWAVTTISSITFWPLWACATGAMAAARARAEAQESARGLANSCKVYLIIAHSPRHGPMVSAWRARIAARANLVSVDSRVGLAYGIISSTFPLAPNGRDLD